MTATPTDFQDCDPLEQRLYSFTFASPPVSAVWNIEVVSGTDADVSSRLVGDITITGNTVVQMVGNLQPGVTYLLQALATMGDGEILSLYSHVTCVALS